MSKILTACVFSAWILFVGCKPPIKDSKANAQTAKEKTLQINSIKDLVNAYENRNPGFETLSADVDVDYNLDASSGSVSFELRMKRDSVIWVSAPLGLMKILLTPEKISFYNKFQKTYYDGSYEMLHQWTGIDVTFHSIQSLLAGDIGIRLDEPSITSYQSQADNGIFLKLRQADLEGFVFLNQETMKCLHQRYSNPKEDYSLEADYVSYKRTDSLTFPEKMELKAVRSHKTFSLKLRNEDLRPIRRLKFPYKIPAGYSRLNIR